MKKIKVFFRRLQYVSKRVIPALIVEFNKKDGYAFSTNFDTDEKDFYIKTLNRLGADYRIYNSATDFRGRPIKGCLALYIRGDYNHGKFMKLYHEYSIKNRQVKYGA